MAQFGKTYSKFPGLTTDQVGRLEQVTAHLQGIEKKQAQQELYRQTITQIQAQQRNDERFAAENEQRQRSLTKSEKEKNTDQSGTRLEDLSDKVKEYYGLDANANTDVIMNGLVSLCNDKGINPDLINNYLKNGDSEILYQLGFEERPEEKTNWLKGASYYLNPLGTLAGDLGAWMGKNPDKDAEIGVGIAQSPGKRGYNMVGQRINRAGAALADKLEGSELQKTVTNMAIDMFGEEAVNDFVAQRQKEIAEGTNYNGREQTNIRTPLLGEERANSEYTQLGETIGDLGSAIAMSYGVGAGLSPVMAESTILGRSLLGAGQGILDMAAYEYGSEGKAATPGELAFGAGGGAVLPLVGPAYKGLSNKYDAIKQVMKESSKKKLGEELRTLFEKGVRPSSAGIKSTSAQEKIYDDAMDAVESIINNKANLKFTNANGEEVIGELPKTNREFAQAISQTKKAIYDKYNSIAQKAGQEVRVSLDDLTEELLKLKKDKAALLGNDLEARVDNWLKGLSEVKDLSVEQAQRKMQEINKKLDAFYRNPNPNDVSASAVDSLVNNKIAEAVDNAIDSALGSSEQYRALKKAYSSLKTIEKDVNHRAIVSGRQSPNSLVDSIADISSMDSLLDILSGNPVGAIKALGKQAIKKYVKNLNSTDNMVKKLFEKAEKGLMSEKNIPIPKEVGLAQNQASSKTAKYQTVYHGSPYEFKEFDSSYMGAGEGNQAHGWGHYVAVDENTSRSYASMKKLDNMKLDGKGLQEWIDEYEKKGGAAISLKNPELFARAEVAKRLIYGDTFATAKSLAKESTEEYLKSIQGVETVLDGQKYIHSPQGLYPKDAWEKTVKLYENRIKAIDDLTYDMYDNGLKGHRNLYEVEIPDPMRVGTPTGSNYFEESATLNKSELSKLADAVDERIGKIKSLGDIDMEDVRKASEILGEKDLVKLVEENMKDNPGRNVKDAFYETIRFMPGENGQRKYWLDDIQNLNKKLGVNAFTTDDFRKADSMQAKDVYRDLSRMLGSDKEASNFLNDIGYDGIHYYGGQDGEAYVIFRDDALNIKNHEKRQKYGRADANAKNITANEGLNIENFKNGRTVKEIADHYGVDTNIVEKILTPEGEKALGMYDEGIITLAETLKESTAPHELLHATFDMVDNVKKTEILNGIKKRLKVDDIEAEEWLADRFSEYYRTGSFDTKGIPTTFVGKVKQFFQQIKEFVDGTYKNKKQIKNLFDDILGEKELGGIKNTPDIRYQTMSDAEMRKWQGKGLKEIGEGKYGPIYTGLKGNRAVYFLLGLQNGEIKGAFDMGGEPVNLIWKGDGVGVNKIMKKHPEALGQIQDMIDKRLNNPNNYMDEGKYVMTDDEGKVVVKLQRDKGDKNMLVTAYKLNP